MDVSVPRSGFYLDGTAGADEVTVRALASSRRWGRVAVVVGVLCLAVLAVVMNVIGSWNDELRRSGGHTSGVLAVLHPDTGKSEGAAEVDYVVDEIPFTRTVDLGADADRYDEGQQVTVHYDRTDPGRMTIDAEDNQPTWTVLPMIIALLLGPVLVIGGCWSAVRDRRIRRVLAGGPWAPIRMWVPWAEKGKPQFFSLNDGSLWQSRTRWPTPNREPRTLSGWGLPDEDPASVPRDQPAWWVSNGRHAVFSRDRGEPLVLARPARKNR